jgi:hypothetical protein
VRFAEVGCPI